MIGKIEDGTLTDSTGLGALQKKSGQENSFTEETERSIECHVKQAEWLKCASGEALDVEFTPRALKQLKTICTTKHPSYKDSDFELFQKSITDVLVNDPRSVYRKTRCNDKLYFFSYNSVHVTCWFDDDDHVIHVLKLKV